MEHLSSESNYPTGCHQEISNYMRHQEYRYNTFLHKLGAHLGRAPEYSEKADAHLARSISLHTPATGKKGMHPGHSAQLQKTWSPLLNIMATLLLNILTAWQAHIISHKVSSTIMLPCKKKRKLH